MLKTPPPQPSVCVFCGSSNAARPEYLDQARQLGAALADSGVRVVYGGGGVGLMGAVARGAHEAGGQVLGVIPEFLTRIEQPLDGFETVVVETMHERKLLMYAQSDLFVVLPGGVGTLEEAIEVLSWKRLDLHNKPVIFFSPDDFWAPIQQLFAHTIAERLTPAAFADHYYMVDTLDALLAAIRAELVERQRL